MGDMNVKGVQTEETMFSYRANHNAKEQRKDKKSVFAGDLGVNSDPIAYKKRQAQREAVKRVVDTIRQEMELDDAVAGMKDNAEKLQAKADASQQKISEMEQLKKQTKEEFGEGEEAEEAYKIWSKDINESIGKYRKEMADALASKKLTNKAITSVGLERLTKHEIVDAQKDSDEMLKIAAEELAYMMYQEGVDHLEEKMDEIVENAKKTAEEEEERQKLLEKAKEKYETTSEDSVDLDALMKRIEKEIKEMLKNNQLLGEDLKGLEVDSIL